MIKFLLFITCLLPLVYKLYQLFFLQLSPDPGGELIDFTGLWGFNFLLITLAISPLAKLLNKVSLKRYRRMLGLFSFFYVVLHGLAIAMFMLGWSFDIFWLEFLERPYMRYGILAFLLMLPMAITSNQFSIKMLKKNWRYLHYAVYPAAILVAIHYWLQIRSDYMQQLVYAVIVAVLLAYRCRGYCDMKCFKRTTT